MAKFVAVAVLAVIAGAGCAYGFPSLWASKDAPNCFAVPTKGYACHKAPQADTASTIALYAPGSGTVPAGAKPLATVCAGKTYAVQASFPEPRLAYLTAANVGTAAARVATNNDLNKKCQNTMVFSKGTGFKPSTSLTTIVTAPAAPGSWVITVASAAGACAPYQITKATIPVAKC